MPRESYEQYRALQSLRRRGSHAESETDLDSLASFSTFGSSSSRPPSTTASHSSRMPAYRASTSYTGPTGPQTRLRTVSDSSDIGANGPPSPTYSHSSLHPSLPGSQGHPPPHTSRHPSLASRTSGTRPPDPSHVAQASQVSPVPHAPRASLEVPRDSAVIRSRRRLLRRQEREKRSTLLGEKYDSPLRRWVRWMSKNGVGGWGLALGLVGVGVVETAVGFGRFSGRDTPPMYGDFEAQRHWMEITLHRPLKEWYTYAPNWWLLDYPPLTAYASWLCGYLGSKLDPEWFELDDSWGRSPEGLVTFMRMSVLCFEAVSWWTAVVGWMVVEGRKGGRSWRSQLTGIMTVLLQPGLMLIDHGHFQYNSVLLGLSLLAILCFSTDRDTFGCVAFSSALCFKQMGLYYAPAVGCYLLGKCIWLGGADGYLHSAKLAAATTLTFIAIFSPWLQPFASLLQVAHRMFPFARGIFEDKVANFWCASNVVLKWRHIVSVAGMARLATLATLAALAPTVAIILYSSYNTRRLNSLWQTNGSVSTIRHPHTRAIISRHTLIPPTIRLLPISLFTSSLSFFLFSFQVHEKSILLPLMPLTVMMAMRGGREGEQAEDELWEVGVLVNNVAVFSMWPLLARDGQALQYVVVTLLWNYVIGYSPFAVGSSAILRRGGYLIYTLIFLIHLTDIFPFYLPPPLRYPDLYVVLNVLLSFGVFSSAWLWGMRKLVEASWAMGGLGGGKGRSECKAKTGKVD